MTQLPTKYLETIKDSTLQYQEVRRGVIKQSGDALHHAKKAIFAMHRDDMAAAENHLSQAKEMIHNLQKTYKKTLQIQEEGSYKAAVEEFVEATLLRQFLLHKKMTKITAISVSDDVFIAGLADLPGELYRYALKAGTEHNAKEVERARSVAAEVVESLIEFDLTKHLRAKFDQAKSSLHKIERVVYELSLQ